MVENKVDLLDDPDNESDLQELKDFGKENEFLESYRTSAKTGLNVTESIMFLVENILKRLKDLENSGTSIIPDRQSVSIDPEKHKSKTFESEDDNKKGCC